MFIIYDFPQLKSLCVSFNFEIMILMQSYCRLVFTELFGAVTDYRTISVLLAQ